MATIDAASIGTADRIYVRVLDTRARAKTGSTRIISARASGAVKTWKTRPGEFRRPYKYGMYESFALTEANAHCWHDSAASAAGGLVWRNPGDSMPMVETRPIDAALAVLTS